MPEQKKWIEMTDREQSDRAFDYVRSLPRESLCTCEDGMLNLLGLRIYGDIDGEAKLLYRCRCGRKVEINESMLPKGE